MNAGKTGQELIDFVNGKLFPYLKTFLAEGTDADMLEYPTGQIFAEITNRFRSGYSLREVIDIVDTLDFASARQSMSFPICMKFVSSAWAMQGAMAGSITRRVC